MLLAVDIGNTNIVLGVLDGENLVYSGRFSTHIHQTVEECAMNLYSFLNIHSIGKIDGAIISSVVPALVSTVKGAVKLVTGVRRKNILNRQLSLIWAPQRPAPCLTRTVAVSAV